MEVSTSFYSIEQVNRTAVKDLKLHGLDYSSSSEQWAASTVRQGRSEAAWGCKPEAGSPANDDDDDDEAVAASTKWGKSFNQASH